MTTQLRRDFIRHMSTIGAAGAVAGIAEAGSAHGEANSGSSAVWPVAESERAAAVIPANLQFAPGDVRRYGADPSGRSDSTQAFLDANAVGSHGGGSIRIPSGQYKYAPSER